MELSQGLGSSNLNMSDTLILSSREDTGTGCNLNRSVLHDYLNFDFNMFLP